MNFNRIDNKGKNRNGSNMSTEMYDLHSRLRDGNEEEREVIKAEHFQRSFEQGIRCREDCIHTIVSYPESAQRDCEGRRKELTT